MVICLKKGHEGMSHEVSLDQLKNALAVWTDQITKQHLAYLGPLTLEQVNSLRGNNQLRLPCKLSELSKDSAQYARPNHHRRRAAS